MSLYYSIINSTSANGINNKGEIVMAWSDSGYPWYPWKGSSYSIKLKTYKRIKGVPGAGPDGSVPVCINDDGDIAFYWWDSSGLQHSALRDDSKYYPFDYPKAYQSFASCLNDKNAIVGGYQTKSNGPYSGYKATFK